MPVDDAVEEFRRQAVTFREAQKSGVLKEEALDRYAEEGGRSALLKGLEAFNQEDVDAVRGELDAERQEVQQVRGPESLDQLETFLSEASDTEREQFLSINIDTLSQAYPGIDKRLDELDIEVGQHVDTSSGFMASIWGDAVDVVGNVVGKGLELLQMPADKTEQLLGLTYWDEMPNGDKWELGRLTYDSAWNDWFGDGSTRAGIELDILRAQMADPSTEIDDLMDGLEEKYSNAWADSIGKIALDPLWLIGGIGFGAKILPAGARATRAGTFVEKGIDFSRIPGIRRVRGLNKIGRRVELDISDDVLREASHGAGPTESAAKLLKTGWWGRLWQKAPQARIDRDLDFLQGYIVSTRQGHVWAAASPQTNGRIVKRELFKILQGKESTLFRPGYKPEGFARLAELHKEVPDLWQTIDKMDSFSRLNTDTPFWAGLREAMRIDGVDWLVRIERDGIGTAPVHIQNRYGAVRASAFLNEVYEKIQPRLIAHHMGLEPNDIIYGADRLSSGIKRGLAYVTLNNPRFFMLNYLSNAFHVFSKGRTIGGTIDMLTHPLGGVSVRQARRLDQAGFTDELLNLAAFDGSIPDIFGIARHQKPGDFAKEERWWKKPFNVFIRQSQRNDQGGRSVGYLKGSDMITASVWHNGPDGLAPAIPDDLKHIPGIQELVESFGRGRSEDVATFFGRYNMTHQASNVDGMIQKYVDEVLWPGHARAQGLDPNDLSNTRHLAESMFPENMRDNLQAIMDDAISSHASGGNWRAEWLRKTDLFRDELEMQTYRMMQNGMDVIPPIPTSRVVDSPAPWQLRAHVDTHFRRVERLQTTLVMRDANTFGSPALAKQVTQRLSRNLQDVRTQADDLLRSIRDQELNADSIKDLRAAWLAIGEEIDAAKIDMLKELQRQPRLRKLVEDIYTRESRNWTRYGAQLLQNPTGVPADAARARFFPRYLREVSQAQSDNMTAQYAAHRIPATPRTGNVGPMGVPTSQQAFAINAKHTHEFMDDLVPRFMQNVDNTRPITDAERAAMRAFSGELNQAIRTLNHIQDIGGRHFADFMQLNYSRKYGIDSMLSVVFPYHFWISRQMHHWMRMSMAQPGYTAAYAKLYEMVAEINEDAGVPARLKNSIRIPMPFMDDIMPGGSGDVFFDPLKMMFPLASFQNDTDFNRGIDRTPLGRVWDGAQQFTMGNPLVTGVAGATGLLGDRDTYVRRSINFPSIGPLPGPRAQRAVIEWLVDGRQPDTTVLSDDEIERIENGEPWTENSLKAAFKDALDFATTDGFDEFRVDRAIATLVGEDPARWTPEAALRALKDREGSLYEAAQNLADSEKGLAALTGWLFTPLRLYPEGEAIQRGLDAEYRAARDEGSEALDQFFGRHPEYRIRQVQRIGDPEDRDQAIDTSLFFIDLGRIDEKYDSEIEQLRFIKAEMERSDFLKTKEGRRQLSIVDNDLDILFKKKEEEIEIIDGLYPNVKAEMSLRGAPRERALFAARSEYFDIRRGDFETADEFFAARNKLVDSFTDEEPDVELQFAAAIEAMAVWSRYSELMAQNPDRRDRLIEERNRKLEALTSEAAGQISKEEFLSYINGSRQAPTPERLEYTEAKQQLTQYFAIDESSGLTERQKSAYQRDFWAQHPLLNKYFGSSEPRAWDAQSAATYGRMTQIWDGWFERQQDPMSAKLYLNNVLEELNELRRSVGLIPLRLIDPLTEPNFNQQPTNLHEQALQEQE